MKLVYPAILRPFSDETGGFVVEFPDLPGCVTEGKDLREAIEMGTDVASGWILEELEEGNGIPAPSKYKEIKVKDNEMVNLMVLDMDSYEEKYGEKQLERI